MFYTQTLTSCCITPIETPTFDIIVHIFVYFDDFYGISYNTPTETILNLRNAAFWCGSVHIVCGEKPRYSLLCTDNEDGLSDGQQLRVLRLISSVDILYRNSFSSETCSSISGIRSIRSVLIHILIITTSCRRSELPAVLRRVCPFHIASFYRQSRFTPVIRVSHQWSCALYNPHRRSVQYLPALISQAAIPGSSPR